MGDGRVYRCRSFMARALETSLSALGGRSEKGKFKTVGEGRRSTCGAPSRERKTLDGPYGDWSGRPPNSSGDETEAEEAASASREAYEELTEGVSQGMRRESEALTRTLGLVMAGLMALLTGCILAVRRPFT